MVAYWSSRILGAKPQVKGRIAGLFPHEKRRDMKLGSIIIDDMKREYDFSQGIRGKFFRPNATIKLPVYLEPSVEAYLNDLAKKKRQTVSALVNRLLKKEIDLLKTIL